MHFFQMIQQHVNGKGPEPKASETVIKASGMRSRWANSEKGGRVVGLELGFHLGPGVGGGGGQEGSLKRSGEACSVCLHGTALLEMLLSCSPGEPKQTDRKWRWASWPPWRRGIQWTAAHMCVLES